MIEVAKNYKITLTEQQAKELYELLRTEKDSGWLGMNYQWEFEKFWGKGAKPETTLLPKEDFDALQKRLAEPPDPAIMERFREILNRKAP